MDERWYKAAMRTSPTAPPPCPRTVCPCRGGGPFLVVELRVLVLRRLVQNEASGLRGLVGDVTDPHDGHPQGWWRYNQPGGEDGHQLALALVRCKCVISDRRARREKTIF